mgnify:CR=1 FL=1|jgi:hypothetical protein
MKLCRIATVIMIIAALLVPTVAAQETGNHSYIVTPAEDTVLKVNSPVIPMTADSIAQGETNWYSTNVAAGTKKLVIDLNWGNASNSLRLRIFAPDAVLGPFYDSYDGTANGRICMSIEDSVGLYPGTWRLEVYGADVDGTEDYTILVSKQ